MKTLPETFKREGWQYTLLKHNKFAALYSMTKSGDYHEYEVWKLRYHKKDKPEMNIEAGDIHTPSTKEWGRYGWSFSRLELAEKEFGRLTDEMSKKQLVEQQ